MIPQDPSRLIKIFFYLLSLVPHLKIIDNSPSVVSQNFQEITGLGKCPSRILKFVMEIATNLVKCMVILKWDDFTDVGQRYRMISLA